MAKRVSRYRVTASVMATLVGKVAELIINTSRNSVHVHDGATAGGFELARADMSNVPDPSGAVNGRMSATLYTELKADSAAITVLQGQMTTANTNIATNTASISTLSSGKIDKVASPVANSFVFQTGAGALVDAGFNFVKGTTVMSFGSAIPSRGWTLDASWNDLLPLGINGSGGGAVAASSWTISGFGNTGSTPLTAAQSGLPDHTHVAVTQTVAAPSAPPGAGPWGPTAGGTQASLQLVATGTVSGGAQNASTGHVHAGIGFTPGWRPASKYVAYASLNP